jgi:hypothetical protein
MTVAKERADALVETRIGGLARLTSNRSPKAPGMTAATSGCPRRLADSSIVVRADDVRANGMKRGGIVGWPGLEATVAR